MQRSSEAAEQSAVIEWAEWNKGKYPCLRWLYHIPNGGSRHPAEAIRLKAQGVKAGVSDLFLPYPCGGYAGIFIEMKHGRNGTTAAQEEFLAYAASVGYKTAVCWSADEAMAVIKGYLEAGQKWKRADNIRLQACEASGEAGGDTGAGERLRARRYSGGAKRGGGIQAGPREKEGRPKQQE
jgi:hypothetical protein